MQGIVSFTKEAENKLKNWVLSVGDHADTWDMSAVISEAFNRVSDRIPGIHEPAYELRGSYTKSGNPETFDFVDSDFIWEEF